MWFKALTTYRWDAAGEISADALSEKLAANHCADPLAGQLASYGFAPPQMDESDYVLETQGCMIICGQLAERVLPASVMNKELRDQIAQYKKQYFREPKAKLKRQMKEEITVRLMAQAFIQHKRTLAIIDTRNGRLLIDTASKPTADRLTAMLRKALGSLPIKPLHVDALPAQKMLSWALQTSPPPSKFTLGSACTASDFDKGKMSLSGLSLTSDHVQTMLEHSTSIEKLQLIYGDEYQFTLNADLTLSSLRPLEILREKASEYENARLALLGAALLQANQLKTITDTLAASMTVEG